MIDDKNLWIDLSWLRGYAREVISLEIQKAAIEQGWHWHTTSGTLQVEDAYLVLRRDGYIVSWSENAKEALENYSSLYEITVNNALHGRFDIQEKHIHTPIFNIGSMVKTSDNKYLKITEAISFNVCRLADGKLYSTDDLQLCEEKRKFKLYKGQKVFNKLDNTYCIFLKYDDDDRAVVFKNKLFDVLNNGAELVPASFRERYSIIKENKDE